MQRTLNHRHPVKALLLTTALLFVCSATAMASPSDDSLQWLQKHNEYRALHGVAAVTWSDTVAASAQAYADTCPTGHSRGSYGENLAWASYDLEPAGVVKLWYDEEPLYDYTNPGFSSATGHFTQVVWKGTAEIGCGHADNCTANGMNHVWVCQYNPPGNVIGQFGDNVFPPGGTTPDVTVLTNGVPVQHLSGAENEKNYFSLAVPGDTDSLHVQTSGGSSNVDLFVKHGALPTLSDHDCSAMHEGNSEECRLDAPGTGTWYIMLAGYLAYSDVTLLASYDQQHAASPVIPPVLFLLQ